MTFTNGWIACLLLLSVAPAEIGCTPKPETVTPAEVRAIIADTLKRADLDMASALKGAGLDMNNASTLHALEQNSAAVADTLHSINIARDVAVNNLNNIGTIGFKGSRTILLAEVKLYTQLDMTQGPMVSTKRDLDVGIYGPGFFKIRIAEELGGVGYTRQGNFFVNNAGILMLGLSDGQRVLPQIHFPNNAVGIGITTDGEVYFTSPGSTAKRVAGSVKLWQFENPEGLKLLEDGVYTATDACGHATEIFAGGISGSNMLKGYLEGSNVDPTVELFRLHTLNRWRNLLVQAMGL